MQSNIATSFCRIFRECHKMNMHMQQHAPGIDVDKDIVIVSSTSAASSSTIKRVVVVVGFSYRAYESYVFSKLELMQSFVLEKQIQFPEGWQLFPISQNEKNHAYRLSQYVPHSYKDSSCIVG